MKQKKIIGLFAYITFVFVFFLTLHRLSINLQSRIEGPHRLVQTMQLEEEGITTKAEWKTSQAAPADFPKKAQLSDPELILVNREHFLPETPTFPEAYTREGLVYNALCQEAYEALDRAAQKAGHHLVCVSAFRSEQDQINNINSQKAAFMKEGNTEAEAMQRIEEFTAPPLGSEHLTGLAFDFVDQQWHEDQKPLDPAFEQEASAQWLKAHASEYGFILRYLKGQEAITGYKFEPWHYRYVGKENAQYIMKHNLTLEEFLQQVKKYNQPA